MGFISTRSRPNRTDSNPVYLDFTGFLRTWGTKIAGFSPIIALDSPLGGQEDCGKGPSCMGEGGVLPPSTAPCPKRVKRQVLKRLDLRLLMRSYSIVKKKSSG